MIRIFLALAACSLLAGPLLADDDASTAVDPRYTWDLSDLYATPEDWEAARQQVMDDLGKIEARRGTLGDSADALYETLSLVSDTLKETGRVFVYATLNGDEDLRNSELQERRQLAQIAFARFRESTAWIQPETLAVGREVIESYLNEDRRLDKFS